MKTNPRRPSFPALRLALAFLVSASGAAAAPARATLFAVDSQSDQTYRIDPLTAAATPIGPAGQNLESAGLALEWRTGRVFVSNVVAPGAIDGGGLGVLDLATGAVQPVPGGTDYLFSLSVPAIAFAGDGTLLGASAINPGLVRLDPNTSVATLPIPWTGTKFLPGFAAAPDGTLFGLDETTLYRVNGTTAVLTPVGPHGMAPTGIVPTLGLAFDPATGSLFASDGGDGRLFRLNPATGAATLIGNTGIRPSGLAITGATDIPALGTKGAAVLALLLGILGIAAMRRRLA